MKISFEVLGCIEQARIRVLGLTKFEKKNLNRILFLIILLVSQKGYCVN